MKRKIICLAICVACLMTVLASCGGTACEAHVDADKNSVCDNCGTPVVTIVEKVPTEEEVVDMIVAAIPEGATLGNVYATTVDKNLLSGEFEAKENLSQEVEMLTGRLVYYMYMLQVAGKDTTAENWPTEDKWTDTENEWTADGYLDDDKYTATFAVYDLLAKKDVFSFTTETFATEEDTEHMNYVRDIVLHDTNRYDDIDENLFFVVTTVTWTEEKEENEDEGTWTYEATDAYYFLNGTKFLDEADVDEDESFYIPREYSNNGQGVAYILVDETVYAIDDETYAILESAHESTMIERPRFNYRTDAYGLVVQDREIFVYDLTKWIECVYSYEVPVGADRFFLDNGNILVQESVILPESAVNYDYTDGRYKYDLVHTLVDIANKTETNLEFGYYVARRVDKNTVNPESADSVKNILEVKVISNKNLGKTLKLAFDDALAIIAEYDAILPEFVYEVELIADGVFKGDVVYGEGSAVTKLFNAKGEELATLPNSAAIYGTYIINEYKFYDFTMKLLFDPAAAEGDEDDYVIMARYDEYVLLLKGDDYYYWNATLAAPVCIVDDTNVEMVPSAEDATVLVPTNPNPLKEQYLVDDNESYYIIRTITTTTTAVEGADPEVDVVTEYVLYNAQGTEIFKSEKVIDGVDCREIDGTYVWTFMCDDTVYLAK